MVSTLALALLAASPEVALLSSSGSTGELRFQSLDAKAPLSAPVVRFAHAEGSPVLGTVLPGTRVVIASAVMKSAGDLSFGSALIRLEAGKPARLLADQLVYGSRPLVTNEARVFVSRGTAGKGAPDEARIDSLTVDEIDPRTAKSRTIFSVNGAFAFLVGAFGREVIIYEVTPFGSRLIAVHADSLGVRPITSLGGLPAHDFTVDVPRKRVLFTHLNAQKSWQVEDVSLVDGAMHVLASGPEVTLLPTVLGDGRVLISRGEGLGLLALDGKEGVTAQGTGFERIVRTQPLLDLHERPSDFPSLINLSTGVVITTPPDARLDVAGVLP